MRGSTVLEKYLIFTKYFGSSTSTSTLHFRQSSTDKIVLKYKYKYRYLTTTLQWVFVFYCTYCIGDVVFVQEILMPKKTRQVHPFL